MPICRHLAYEKRKEELKCTIDIVFPIIKDRKSLEELAVYAEEAEYNEARIWIWEKIVASYPCDPLAWQALAKAQFDARAYCLAGISLRTFFCLNQDCNPKLYEIFYEYAEVLRKERNFSGSRHYYHLALNQIAQTETQTPYSGLHQNWHSPNANFDAGRSIHMKEIAALSYYEVYRKPKGLAMMKEYYKMSGRDPNAAAAYANMLMDNGRLGSAENFLYDSFVQPRTYAQ